MTFSRLSLRVDRRSVFLPSPGIILLYLPSIKDLTKQKSKLIFKEFMTN